MAEFGLNIRFYPPEIISSDSVLAIDIVQWENGSCLSQDPLLQEHIDLDGASPATLGEDKWLAMVLECAAQVAENFYRKAQGGSISGTHANRE